MKIEDIGGEVVQLSVDEIIPYANNPRINKDAVQYVAESIKEFGFKNPILVDKDYVIIAGHTRLLAAKKLKKKTVPCLVVSDLTDEQVRALRLADNKTAEFAEWDEDLLSRELKDIFDLDMSRFGFNLDPEDMGSELEDDTYTMKVNIPQYEITGDNPSVSDLYDMGKTNELIDEIVDADIDDEIKDFLIEAAKRHTVFNYRNIAEYYAHADPEVQRLFEKSALVIIDVDNAIANGYATLSSEILELMEDDDA